MSPSTHPTAPSPHPTLTTTAVVTRQKADNHVDDANHAVDDGHEDGADAVDDAHDGAADGAKDALDLFASRFRCQHVRLLVGVVQ